MAEAGNRACLHCALDRAVRAEAAGLQLRAVRLTVEPSEPVLLPLSGIRIYRALRLLLRQLQVEASGTAVKLSVLGWLAGKSGVEITAVYYRDGAWRVLSQTFPRYVESVLWHGFDELVYAGD